MDRGPIEARAGRRNHHRTRRPAVDRQEHLPTLVENADLQLGRFGVGDQWNEESRQGSPIAGGQRGRHTEGIGRGPQLRQAVSLEDGQVVIRQEAGTVEAAVELAHRGVGESGGGYTCADHSHEDEQDDKWHDDLVPNGNAHGSSLLMMRRPHCEARYCSPR